MTSDDDFIYPPEVGYYLIGDVSWEDLKAADQEKWSGLDWTSTISYGGYTHGGSSLWAYHLSKYSSGSSGEIASQGYDPRSQYAHLPLQYHRQSPAIWTLPPSP